MNATQENTNLEISEEEPDFVSIEDLPLPNKSGMLHFPDEDFEMYWEIYGSTSEQNKNKEENKEEEKESETGDEKESKEEEEINNENNSNNNNNEKDPGEVRRIIFIMGLATSLRAWGPQIKFFSDPKNKTEALFFDNKGIGRSTFPKKTSWRYTTSGMATDALSLLDHLKWKQYHIAGVSMGGMIAQELALLSPTRVLSLTLGCTYSGYSPAPTQGIKSMVYQIFFSKNQNDRLNTIAEMVFSPNWLEKKNKKNETNRETYVKDAKKRIEMDGIAPFKQVLAQTFAVNTHNVSPDRLKILKNSNFPICVCTGTIDHMIRPHNSDYLKTHLDPHIYKVWEGTGHGIQIEKASDFNNCILELFKKVHGN